MIFFFFSCPFRGVKFIFSYFYVPSGASYFYFLTSRKLYHMKFAIFDVARCRMSATSLTFLLFIWYCILYPCCCFYSDLWGPQICNSHQFVEIWFWRTLLFGIICRLKKITILVTCNSGMLGLKLFWIIFKQLGELFSGYPTKIKWVDICVQTYILSTDCFSWSRSWLTTVNSNIL